MAPMVVIAMAVFMAMLPRLFRGASANVVMLGIAKKAGHPISFWDFTRKGAIVATATVAVAAPYLYLRYFA